MTDINISAEQRLDDAITRNTNSGSTPDEFFVRVLGLTLDQVQAVGYARIEDAVPFIAKGELGLEEALMAAFSLGVEAGLTVELLDPSTDK